MKRQGRKWYLARAIALSTLLVLLGYATLTAQLQWQRWGRWLLWLMLAVVFVRFGFSVSKEYRSIRKRERLLALYPDEKIVDDILNQVLWEGESHEQVLASLGEPEAINSLQRRTKKKEVWKYGHEGGNRFRLRIVLDNDRVVGWKLRT
ncbi:MAG: hypothetical protein ACR2PZ_13675 [Pseudomonadales bacterium]